MDHDIVKEAVQRIRGLPTFSRIRDEIRNKFALEISEEELKEDIEEMIEEEKLKEKYTTIKGNKFKGYMVVKKETKKEETEEEKTEEERIIDEIFDW